MILQGPALGVTKGGTGSLDYSSFTVGAFLATGHAMRQEVTTSMRARRTNGASL